MKQGFKQTEIGLIPKDWRVAKLGEIASISTGSTPSTAHREFYGDEFLFVSPVDLSDAKWIKNTAKKLSSIGFGISRRFPKSSILFTCIGSTIGKCGVATVDLTSNQQINAVMPSPTYNTDFLYYALCLLSPSIRRLAGEQAVPLINKTQFSETLIPLPALPEQKAIAGILNDTDALIESLNQVLEKKRNVRQAVTHQLLSGKIRLPGFGGVWDVRCLGDFGATFGGLSGKSKEDFGHGGGRYITFMNIMGNVVIDCNALELVEIAPTESQNRVAVGDIFFNGSSETAEEVGMCAVLLNEVHDVFLNSFCFGFRLHQRAQADGLYLAYYFRSQEGRKLLKSLGQGAIRYNLSKTALLKLPFRIPSHPEQIAIAGTLSDIDAEIAGLEKRCNKVNSIKQGLMQKLLTGKTRLL